MTTPPPAAWENFKICAKLWATWISEQQYCSVSFSSWRFSPNLSGPPPSELHQGLARHPNSTLPVENPRSVTDWQTWTSGSRQTHDLTASLIRKYWYRCSSMACINDTTSFAWNESSSDECMLHNRQTIDWHWLQVNNNKTKRKYKSVDVAGLCECCNDYRSVRCVCSFSGGWTDTCSWWRHWWRGEHCKSVVRNWKRKNCSSVCHSCLVTQRPETTYRLKTNSKTKIN